MNLTSIDRKIQLYIVTLFFFVIILTSATFSDDLTPSYHADNQNITVNSYNVIKIFTSLPLVNLTINFSCLKCNNTTTIMLYIMNETQYTTYYQTGSIDKNIVGTLMVSNYTESNNNVWLIHGNTAWYIVVLTNGDSKYSLVVSTFALTETELWATQLQILLIRFCLVLPFIVIGLLSLGVIVRYLRRSELIAQKESRKKALEQQFKIKFE